MTILKNRDSACNSGVCNSGVCNSVCNSVCKSVYNSICDSIREVARGTVLGLFIVIAGTAYGALDIPEGASYTEPDTVTDIETDTGAENTEQATEEPPTETRPGREERKEEIEQPEEDIAEAGITTVHLPEPQGNWYFKRLWWEQALQRYEKIRQYVEAVLDARPEFFVKRADIDKTLLAPFYMAIGLDQGELKKITVELLDYIEQQRRRTDLTEQERVTLRELEDAEKELKRVKADIDMISTIYDRMNDDINVLFGQIKQVREYDQKAWENFKKIADIVSDTEAKNLYYEMGKLKNSIIAIHTYIEQEFSTHFNDLVAKMSAKTEAIEDALQSLKNKGFDIQEQRETLFQKSEPCVVPTVTQEQEPVEVEEAEEHGVFYTYFVQPVYSVISYIGSGISTLYKWVMGRETQESEPEQNNTETRAATSPDTRTDTYTDTRNNQIARE